MPIPITPKRVENFLINLQDVDGSIPTPIRSTVRLKEVVRIPEQEPGETLRVRVPAAEVSFVETEGLEVRGGREGHEGTVVDGHFVPARAKAHDVDGVETLLVAWTDDCEEAMEGVGVVELEVLAVQDVDGFVVDLFADGEEVWDERGQLGSFVWFLALCRFATPCRTLSVSASVSVLFIPNDGSTDRSSVRFGFGRNPDAGIFGEGHLVDHVAKFWRQFHEWEWLLGFLAKVGMLCSLLLWCLFGCFLGSVSE
jgi:hypothetical protein